MSDAWSFCSNLSNSYKSFTANFIAAGEALGSDSSNLGICNSRDIYIHSAIDIYRHSAIDNNSVLSLIQIHMSMVTVLSLLNFLIDFRKLDLSWKSTYSNHVIKRWIRPVRLLDLEPSTIYAVNRCTLHVTSYLHGKIISEYLTVKCSRHQYDLHLTRDKTSSSRRKEELDNSLLKHTFYSKKNPPLLNIAWKCLTAKLRFQYRLVSVWEALCYSMTERKWPHCIRVIII